MVTLDNMSSMTLCEAACLYHISESFKFIQHISNYIFTIFRYFSYVHSYSSL